MECSVVINKPLKGTVNLVSSKSISNRLLIIQALAGEYFDISNLSSAADTQDLLQVLKQNSSEIDAGEGGTTFRFLLAYLAQKPGRWTLTCRGHMKWRPIQPLLQALKELGAEIAFSAGNNLPLLISGKQLKGGAVEVDGSISSQFLSALLLIAPYMREGLQLKVRGQLVSAPYLQMTVAIMRKCGARVDWESNCITVYPVPYHPRNQIAVEADWSAAAFFYALTALSDKSSICLSALRLPSLQGDAVAAEVFEDLGVRTIFELEYGGIEKVAATPGCYTFDALNFPDLVPPLVVAAAGKGIELVVQNCHHLEHKESNRMMVLQEELAKIGVRLEQTGQEWTLFPAKISVARAVFDSHNDHRMAMAFACLAAVMDEVKITRAEAVAKSYPQFWDHLSLLGADVSVSVSG